LTIKQRIDAFTKLGLFLKSDTNISIQFLESVTFKNPWYTKENVIRQLEAISANLSHDKLNGWLKDVPSNESQKTVGLVLAGNLPLVGFHDILCVLITGFSVQIKPSSEDAGLTSFILNELIRIEPLFKNKINFVERLANYDLIIATGSNNSSRYFEYYFGNKPHIIRKNRNSLAVLDGNESEKDLTDLGHDIFDYFGLGCRSVSLIFIPQDYDIATLYEGLEKFQPVINHFKYNNNYDFNKSIYLINKKKHFDNGFLLLTEDSSLSSPLAVVHFQRYNAIEEVKEYIAVNQQSIQCVTSQIELNTSTPTFALGASQWPELSDYADGIDTIDFLIKNQ